MITRLRAFIQKVDVLTDQLHAPIQKVMSYGAKAHAGHRSVALLHSYYFIHVFTEAHGVLVWVAAILAAETLVAVFTGGRS